MTSEMFPLAPVSAVADVQLGKMLQPRQLQPDNILRPYVHASNIQEPGQLDLDHSLRKMYFSPREVAALAVEAGDVLLVEGGSVGRPAYVFEDLDGYGFQNSINRVRANDRKASGRFLYHALSSAYQSGEIASYCSSVSIPHFTAEKVSRFRIPLPSLDEQRRIADFLDKETREIDRVVGVLDELIEDLEARFLETLRTKTQFKEDGSQWARCSTGALFRSIGGGTTPAKDKGFYCENDEEGSIPWITTSELREKEIFTTAQNVTSNALENVSSLKVHPKGSIAIAMYGATIGRLGILGTPATTNQACCVFSNPIGVDEKFFYYSLWADREEIIRQSAGGGQPNISQARLIRWKTPLPPLEEQRRIADYIDEETSRIDKMRDTATELREELIARRKAIITEYVTGQKRVG